MIKFHADVQLTLQRALNYWAFTSISSESFVRTASRRLFLNSEPLRSVIRAMAAADIRLSDSLLSGIPNLVRVRTYAIILADLFSEWEEHQPESPESCRTLPKSASYEKWSTGGGSANRYGPVHRIRRGLGKSKRFFLRASVHGSVATLDDVDGFSDLDLVFVVRHATLTDPDELTRMRTFFTDVLAEMYAYDPYMHHGPNIIPESYLRWFPEHTFPLVLFENAVDLIDSPQPLPVSTRPVAEGEMEAILGAFRNQFERILASGLPRSSWREMEWLLASVMFIPLLYQQSVSGVFRYKREALPEAQKAFGDALWRPVSAATEQRTHTRHRPRAGSVVRKLALFMRWPGLIARSAEASRAVRREASITADALSPDYMEQVLSFLSEIETRLRTDPSVCCTQFGRNESVRLYAQSLTGVEWADRPEPAAGQEYEDHISKLAKHWSQLRPTPSAIYRIGEISAPGISDIDLVVIYKNADTLIDVRPFLPMETGRLKNRFLTHEPFICTEDLWRELPLWYPTFSMCHVYGKQLEPPVIPVELEDGISLGLLVDSLLMKMPADILKTAWQRPVPIRLLLCMLNSFKYTLYLAGKCNIPVISDHKELAKQIGDLRTMWFSDHSEAEAALPQLFAQVCCAIGEITGQVDRLLQSSGATPKKLYSRGNAAWRFSNSWNCDSTMLSAYDHHLNGRKQAWSPPASFQSVLSVYATVNPDFASYLGHCSNTATNWDGGPWREGLIAHAAAMVRYTETVAKLGLPANRSVALAYSAGATAVDARINCTLNRFRQTKQVTTASRQLRKCSLSYLTRLIGH